MKICHKCGVNEANHGRQCSKCKNRETYYRNMKPCGCGCEELVAKRFAPGHHTRLLTSEEQSRRGRMNNGDAQRGSGVGLSYRKRNGRHEHRTVAEKSLGRPLGKGEVVHHIDGDKFNNSPENLQVMTQSEHIELHRQELNRGRKKKDGHVQIPAESGPAHPRP